MAGIEGDVWREERDRSNDPIREPGPIDLNRCGVAMYGGIPTFMNFPTCLTQEDLKAGKADVAVLGAPVDMSSGQRGTAFGPRTLRTAGRYIPGGTSLTAC
jgi:agmatinase